jgi:carotenoid cleavage dioxygenase-like enzyme
LLRVEAGQVRRFEREGMTYGEPISVPSPHGDGPTDGVILSVGCHQNEPLSSLVILDAQTMLPIAHCDLDISLPLGFHGNFQAR